MIAYLSRNDLVPILCRILIACVCGGLIGLERAKRQKEAGVRTHCIIAATAALLMVMSKYGFADLYQNGEWLFGTHGVDAARIAAQIVVGISFLGAGVIFRNGTGPRGLTTASGMWATAAVGMAVGGNMLIPGLMLTAIVVVIQLLFHSFNIGKDMYSENDVFVRAEATERFRDSLFEMSEKKEIRIVSFRVVRTGPESMEYEVAFRTRGTPDPRMVLDTVEKLPDIREMSFTQ